MINRKNLKIVIGFFIVILIIFLEIKGFEYLNKNDNKYYNFSVQPEKGVLKVDDDSFNHNNFICLIDDWEFYNNELLMTNKLTNDSKMKEYVFIGQYSNYSMRKKGESPFGQASYKLKIINNGSPKTLSMEIPELFSASKVWIDSKLVSSLGRLEKNSYSPRVNNQVISFYLNKEVDIVIEISNYSHYYSGLFYPPILGSTETVTSIIIVRLIFYGVLCFTSIAIAVYSMGLWTFRKKGDNINLIYGVMCLFFGIHVSYPFIRWLGVPMVNLLYAIEDVSEYIVVLCIVLISSILANQNKRDYYKKIVIPIGIFMCIATFFLPSYILPRVDELVYPYGIVLNIYLILVGVYILRMSFASIRSKRKGGFLLLCANTIYAVSLIVDVLTSNEFEPIYTGWQNEYIGFVIIVLFSFIIKVYLKEIVLENKLLTENLEKQVEARTNELLTLLKERKKLLSDIAHDLKAPVASIKNFIEYIKMGNVHIDSETSTYLSVIEKKSNEIQNRVVYLQKINMEDTLSYKKIPTCFNNFLMDLYDNIVPDSEAKGVYFNINLPKEKLYLNIDRDKMTRALENIIYNALDFTSENGKITIDLEKQENIILKIRDTGKGIKEEDINKIFGREYSYRNNSIQSGRGLGLSISKVIIEAHNGSIKVDSKEAKGTCFTIEISSKS